MFSRISRSFFYTLVLGVLLFAGWACGKYGNTSGISDSQVVASVGDHKITFADWMKQMDLLRVFSPQPTDPNNSQQVKDVLDSLIDQEIVLGALQKSNYTDAKFDELSKKELLEAGLQLKDIKDKLVKDMETINRLEKNYKDGYLKMLLAQHYAASKVDAVQVTDKEAKDKYVDLVKTMTLGGQKAPAFEKVKDQIKLRLRADKLLAKLQGDRKINRQEDVINKYLTNLSHSSEILKEKGGNLAPAPSNGMKDGGTK